MARIKKRMYTKVTPKQAMQGVKDAYTIYKKYKGIGYPSGGAAQGPFQSGPLRGSQYSRNADTQTNKRGPYNKNSNNVTTRNEIVTIPHTEGTFSYTTLGKYTKPSKKELLEKIHYNLQYDGISFITSGTGLQGVPPARTSMAVNSPDVIYQPFSQLYHTGNGIVQPMEQSQKIKVLDYSLEQKYYNASNFAADIILYDVVSRTDLDATNNNCQDAWSYATSLTSGTMITQSLPGNTPYTSPNFCQKFKIIKTTKLTINPGATHTHKVTDHRDYIISGDRINGTGTGTQFLKDHTISTMQVVLGQHCVGTATGNTIGSFAPSRISLIYKGKVQLQAQPHTGVMNQVTATQINTGITPAIINIDSNVTQGLVQI